MKTKEIELKITLPREELKLLEQWLQQHARFVGEQILHDYYFDDAQSSFYDSDQVLRVRFAPHQSFVCYKQWYYDEKTGERTYCDEFETVVGNGQRMKQIFLALGYKLVVSVEKKRKSYTVDGFAIAIDLVKDLGIFVEIELAEDIHDVQVGIRSIYVLLKKMGVHKFEVQRKGYSAMMRHLLNR